MLSSLIIAVFATVLLYLGYRFTKKVYTIVISRIATEIALRAISRTLSVLAPKNLEKEELIEAFLGKDLTEDMHKNVHGLMSAYITKSIVTSKQLNIYVDRKLTYVIAEEVPPGEEVTIDGAEEIKINDGENL